MVHVTSSVQTQVPSDAQQMNDCRALVLRAWRGTCRNQQSWQDFWRRQVLLEMDIQRGGRENHDDGGSLLSLFWEFGI